MTTPDVPQSVYDKIRKCLALAASPHPGEAETAMRQARKLMEKYGLDDTEVAISEVTEIESDIPSHRKKNWHMRLVNIVAKLMGVTLYLRYNCGTWGTGKVVFVGTKSKVELAEYLYTVVRRQLFDDRKDFFEQCDHRYSRSKRMRLADFFCERWMLTVEERLEHMFCEPAPVVQQYMDRRHGNLSACKPNINTSMEGLSYKSVLNAFELGDEKGKAAQINLAMGTDAEGNPLLEDDFRKLGMS